MFYVFERFYYIYAFTGVMAGEQETIARPPKF